MPQTGRWRRFLQGLAKFLALVIVAGGVGVALGIGLSKVSAGDDSALYVGVGAQTSTADPAGSASIATRADPPTTTPATTATATPARTATTPSPPPSNPFSQIRVSVLDSRLFTDETPSGRQAQRARVTVRIRAANSSSRQVVLAPPVLRVGSVRIPADAAADAPGSRFEPLAGGATQTVTLRFSLDGEATPKVVRDRRARITVAGRSVAMRVKLRAPAR